MIFVTVGTQLAFDRLIRAVDGWAGRHAGHEFFAQIGPGDYKPAHMAHADFVAPARVDEFMQRADLIVSHAGMGSILTALRYQTPILVMPRQAALGEHRNEHQRATARWLGSKPGVFVAWDETELVQRLDARAELTRGVPIPPFAEGPLVERLAGFIHGR